MRNRSHGFTLIELLIVIAIIGILAAVLIPNLLNARARAYDSASNSCANSLQTAQEIYWIDNDAYAAEADFDDLIENLASGCLDPDSTEIAALADTIISGLAVTVVDDAEVGWSATVEHPRGRTAYTVTQSSITAN